MGSGQGVGVGATVRVAWGQVWVTIPAKALLWKRNLFIECFKQFLLLAEGISLHNDDLERKLRSGLS